MNQNSQIIKKRDDFKKEIRKEQIQKKRLHIRQTLPYYDALFINAAVSRSSRFPVPNKSSRHSKKFTYQRQPASEENNDCCDIDSDSSEKQSQTRYIEYLQGICRSSSISQYERRQKISSEFDKMYGNDCFDSMPKLIQKISVDVTECEHELMSDQDQNLQKMDWGFVQAVLYFSEDQQLEDIYETCLNLMTKYFIPWYQGSIQSKIYENMPLSDFLKILDDTDEDLRTIEDIILAHYIQLSQQNELDQQKVSKVIRYFSQKLEMFQELQRHLQTSYEQEDVHFSEIFYNFPSLYFIETLSQTISFNETSTELKILAFTLINKYFGDYPDCVESQTQTNEKLKTFILGHVCQLNKFFKVCESGDRVLNLDPDYLTLIQTTLALMNSMAWRDLEDDGLLTNMIALFIKIVHLIVKFGVTKEIAECLDLHIKMLEFFNIVFLITDQVKELCEESAILDYFNTLLFNLQAFKLDIRREGITLEIEPKNLDKFINMEFLLIQSLYITKQNISSVQFTHTDQQWIKGMFKYVSEVYEKEKRLMADLKKRGKEGTVAKDMFLFEKCINFYFSFMSNEKGIFNPETSEQYSQEDVSI